MDRELMKDAPLRSSKQFALTVDTYGRVYELVLHTAPSTPKMILHMCVNWGAYDKGEVAHGKRILHLNKRALRAILAMLMRDLVSTWGKKELQRKHDADQQAIDELINLYAEAYG